jgi:hypothetical protein
VWILCEYAHAVKSHDTSRTSASVGLSSAAWPHEFSWFFYAICLMSHARAQNILCIQWLYPPRVLKCWCYLRMARACSSLSMHSCSHLCDCPSVHLAPLRVRVNFVLSSEHSGKVILRCLIFLYVVWFSDPPIQKRMDTPPTRLYKKMDTPSNEESQHENEDWLGSDDTMHESKGIAAGLKALLVRLLGALFIIDGRRGKHAPDFDCWLVCALISGQHQS